MKYAVERLSSDLINEIMEMLNAYYKATPASTDIPPYDFQWDAYFTLDYTGQLHITTARDADKLVGIALYIVTPALHHKSVVMAECDSLSVDHTYRGRGLATDLYTFTEQKLRERGVQFVLNHYRHCYGAKPVFEKLGFVPWNTVYMKKLVEEIG